MKYSLEFKTIRLRLLLEGEENFERKVLNRYPYVVSPNYPEFEDDKDACLDYIDRAEAWLSENISTGYKAFPPSAMGKYARCCRNVYFRNERDALYFKLGCSY